MDIEPSDSPDLTGITELPEFPPFPPPEPEPWADQTVLWVDPLPDTAADGDVWSS